MISISKGNKKIGNVWNVSLTPGLTCGDVPCKRQCYAQKAWRMYPSVRKCWGGNWEEYQILGNVYFDDIVFQIGKKPPKLFRWHVAGDIPDYAYLVGMVRVALDFPSVKFLAFTKQYYIVNQYLDFGPLPENLTIVFSAWPGFDLKNPHSLPIAWMQNGKETRVPIDALECHGNCEGCGLCWNLPTLGRDVVFEAH